MTFKIHIKKAIKKLDQLSPYPFFYPFIMSKDEIAVFDIAIKESRHYLEFGLGGSTLRVIQKSKAMIYTVESSSEWLKYMRKYMTIRYFENKRLNICHVDIGPTSDWGYPESDDFQDNFEAYSSRVFKSVDKNLIDLALIDGRFRVACILKLIIECHQNKKLQILIHDFWNREHYHVVLKYLKTVKKADTIGLFSINNDLDIESVKTDYKTYKHDPA